MRRYGVRRRTKRIVKRRYAKRRYSRKAKITRALTKYDGVHAVKLVIQTDIAAAAGNPNLTSFVIGWAGNVNTAAALQHFDAPEWTATSALYEMCKIVGVSIKVEPVQVDNQPGNRTIRAIHSGSFPNLSTSSVAAALPSIAATSQRLDYKSYNGDRKLISRYYKVSKALKSAIRQEGMTPSGYHACVNGGVATRVVDMGCTVFTVES